MRRNPKQPPEGGYDYSNLLTEVCQGGFLMPNLQVMVSGTPLTAKEHEGQRVVTLREIDAVHQRPDGTARKRFNDNRAHFIEGVDFFKVKCSEVRPFFGQTPPNGFNPDADIVLITESGYLMLVKSFTDDLAWTVQRQLVNTYFRATDRPGMVALPKDYPSALRALADDEEKRQALEAQVEAFKPIQRYVDTILQSPGTMTTTQIAADYDLTAYRLNKILNEAGLIHKVSGQWILYQRHMGKGYTKSETIEITRSNGRPDAVLHTRWTQRGRMAIHNILTTRGIRAIMDREV